MANTLTLLPGCQVQAKDGRLHTLLFRYCENGTHFWVTTQCQQFWPEDEMARLVQEAPGKRWNRQQWTQALLRAKDGIVEAWGRVAGFTDYPALKEEGDLADELAYALAFELMGEYSICDVCDMRASVEEYLDRAEMQAERELAKWADTYPLNPQAA